MPAHAKIAAHNAEKDSNQVPNATGATAKTNKRDFHPIVYTEEDLYSIRQVRRAPIEEHDVDPNKIGLRVLALTTIINRGNQEESVKAYLKFRDAVAMVGIDSFEEDINSMSDVEEYLGKCYEPCGVNEEGQRVVWIRGKQGPSPEEEKAWIQATILYWMAIHADDISLREGVQSVMDVSSKPKDTFGNSQKLQKINQCYPLHSQTILVAGTNAGSRVFLNGLIKVGSVFSRTDVLKRIKFVSLEDAKQSVSKEDSPQYVGGAGGGIDNVVDWVKERLDNFPVPEL